MSDDHGSPAGPDLTAGISRDALVDGKLVGHVGDEDVLVVRTQDGIFAIGAHCSHYHGPLAEGLVVGNSVRCPWHHACFDLRTGRVDRPPALSDLDCWHVEEHDGRIVVREKRARWEPAARASAGMPERIVIVGGGAAGLSAASTLRRESYAGSIVMLSAEPNPPVDRPNLSKDYLAGSAPEDWLPLRPDDFYAQENITLRLNSEVAAIDVKDRRVRLASGETIPYDRLLLATGAEPVKLPIPGAARPHVFTLRTLADSRAIIAAAGHARRVVVIGASFIGLEVAASLRTRGLEVHVVAPEQRPMERVLGARMGDFVRNLHEAHGVVFHLEDTVTEIREADAMLKSGATLAAELVVMGVGVRPRLGLAQAAGLSIDRGVVVDAYLETSAAGIFAAGDIARWPDPHTGENIRVEHWVVAERQGQTAARNMMGLRERFDAVPFFWSQHYDVPINYVGHAEAWDDIAIEGDIAAKDCLLRYQRAGRDLAVASIFRDVENLKAEVAMEKQ
jgi:NADPH-dependent 2,4-dienoyl-CoA reductase/sulfur reductase-like enzyme/nitrite reductase/ring-hydroxylating ferredoxin subunit